MAGFCRYQCAAHHGVTVHSPACPSTDPDRAVCDGCAAEVQAIEAHLMSKAALRRLEQSHDSTTSATEGAAQ